jgi:hypothetical protein
VVNAGGERPAGVDASAGQGVQAGDRNSQVNDFSGGQSRLDVSGGRDAYGAGRDLTVNNYGAVAAGPGPVPPVVVGDVPQEPAAFQLRPGLLEALGRVPGGRVSVVFAVTGIRGGWQDAGGCWVCAAADC